MTEFNASQLKQGDALVIVDVQKDFLPGGSLAVEDGDAVVPVLNSWTNRSGFRPAVSRALSA